MKFLPFFLLTPFSVPPQNQPTDKHPIPDWLIQNWEAHMTGNGVWITDNSEYKSENEPFDAYGMKWEWGLGKKSLKGNLYCIRDGENVGTVWEFLTFWDSETGTARMIQIGGTGMVGKGEMWRLEDGSTKSKEQFTAPDGTAFTAGHHVFWEDGNMATQSFDIKNKTWTKRRFYVWKPEKKALENHPKYNFDKEKPYEKLTFFIGDWEMKIGTDRAVRMSFEWAQNERMIRHKSSMPSKIDDPVHWELEGIITYHAVKNEVIMTDTYLKKGSTLIAEGCFNFLENGAVERQFTCFYGEGKKLPWHDGAVAPEGGKTLDFKQIWTPLDDQSFQGEFYWKKDGKWENPIKEFKDGKKELWVKVK